MTGTLILPADYTTWLSQEWRDLAFVQQAVAHLDDRLKIDEDKPTLGLLLCKQQHRVVAEYALRGMTQPIGIAEYRLQLPDELAAYLPSIEQIEAEFQDQE
jgi:hypothetical protein